jgi:TRAP transporter TAXI family solute receptor
MTVRRRLILAVCAMLALAIPGLACTKPAPTTPAEQRPQDVELTLFGFVAGGGSQFRIDSISEAIRVEYPDWKVTSKAAGGEAALISKRIAGEADFFLTPYLRRLELEVQIPLHPEINLEKATEYYLVAPTTSSYVHFFARDKTKLTSISDIVVKKLQLNIGAGPGGSSLLFSKILGYYGTNWAEAESWGLKREVVIVTTPDGVEALQSGRIDVGLSWAEVPAQAYIGVTSNLKLMPINDPGLVQMLKDLGFYQATIPAKTYPFVTEDVPTVAQTEFLAVRPDMPEDIVYYTLKALFNNKGILSAAGAGSKLTPEAIAASMITSQEIGVPFHPGALRFYREMGWIK